MRKRIFVGIPITKDLSKLIGKWADENIKTDKIRIMADKNLHLTLVPPWYAIETGSIINKLDPLKKENSFMLNFNKINYGPKPKNPRLVWVKSLFSKELISIKERCNQLLLANTKPDNRTFLPHLTIARFNPKDFQHFKNKEIDQDIDWEMPVDRVNLYESHLSPKGATYDIVASIRFNNNGKSSKN